MKDMYETQEYLQKNPTWHEEDAPWKARQVARLLTECAIPCQTIVEVGCGTGDILLTLEKLMPNCEFRGYEIAPDAFERAKVKETARTKFFFEDLLTANAPRCDVLLVMDVIEHVEDLFAFIKGCRPLATYAVFHIPLDLSAQSIARSWPVMKLREDVGHVHYFYKETALATLRDCGYRIRTHRYTASRLELPNQALSSKLMRLPRRAMFAWSQDLTVRLLGGYSLLALAE